MNDKEIQNVISQYEKYGLDEDDKEILTNVIKSLQLHIGDKICVYDYDDEDLMDFIEERGSNEFIVSDFDYYDGTVWSEDCDYGIDMQYVANLSAN